MAGLSEPPGAWDLMGTRGIEYRATSISQATVMAPNRTTAHTVFRKLATQYGQPVATHPHGKPLDVLIETILSQHTSDKNSHRAYLALRRAFPRWDDVLSAPPHRIKEAIRFGGLAQQKSRRIKEVLGLIKQREGRLTLTRIKRMDDDEAYAYLTSLPGVGGKTACCVLLFALDRPVMPVDTHIQRIVKRIGWIRPNGSPDQARAVLEKCLSPALLYGAHVLLIAHGRQTCTARRPACRECPIRRHCATGRAVGRKKRPSAIDAGPPFV